MSAIRDFKIEGAVLKEYRGTGRRDVVIPEGVTSIGEGAFEGCTALTAVVIPVGVTSIGGGAFDDCTGLTAEVIPAGVISIGEGAFWGCTGLTEITLPGSLETIEDEAFLGCLNLEKIWVDGTDEEVERIRALLPEDWRSTVHSELRRTWLRSVHDAAGADESSATASSVVEGHPSKKAKPSPTSTPLLATLLSDGMRMCIPPAAVAVDEATSHQVVSEYAGMVALFL